MDRLRELEVFLAVADAGSLAAAATGLRLSPPAVTRAVAALEDRLGAAVFTRTTRSLTLTEVGQRLLDGARRLVADYETTRQAAVGAAASPRGRLVVTASVTFGRSALAPVVCDFLDRFEGVTVSLLLVDRVANLVEEGIDVAVRIGALPDSGLVARRIGEVRRVLVASPDYLARRGQPATPGDLKRHAFIGFTGLAPYRARRGDRTPRAGGVALSPRFEVNDALAAIQAAESGRGITVALSYMVAGPIRDGRLIEVLADAAPRLPAHIVYPPARLMAPKLRAFIDFAAPRLESAIRDAAP